MRTHIALSAAPGCGGFSARIHGLNALYRKLAAARGVNYIELFATFDDGSGQIRADFSEDELHLNGPGYKAWREVLAPFMART